MKTKGSTSDFAERMDRELMDAYRSTLRETEASSGDEFYNRVTGKGCSRFWVSEERAAVVMGRMDRGGSLEGMKQERREMYRELHDRYRRLRERHRDMTATEATFRAVNSPAGRFYLSPATARSHIYRMMRERRQERAMASATIQSSGVSRSMERRESITNGRT